MVRMHLNIVVGALSVAWHDTATLPGWMVFSYLLSTHCRLMLGSAKGWLVDFCISDAALKQCCHSSGVRPVNSWRLAVAWCLGCFKSCNTIQHHFVTMGFRIQALEKLVWHQCVKWWCFWCNALLFWTSIEQTLQYGSFLHIPKTSRFVSHAQCACFTTPSATFCSCFVSILHADEQ